MNTPTFFALLLTVTLLATPSPASLKKEKPKVKPVPESSTAYETERLEQVLEKLQNDPDLKYASWGICVMDAKSGEVVVGHDINRTLIPASSLKLLTTSTIFAFLDPEDKFETQLQYDGTFNKTTGVLDGNLYIKGGGDPTLGSYEMKSTPSRPELMRRWVKEIKEAGITEVRGNIIGDSRFFEDDVAPSSWTYGDMGNYYGASANGLTFSDNTFRILFRSGTREGELTKYLHMEPEIPGLKIHNIVTTGPLNSWDNAYIHGAPLNDMYVIKGTIPPGKKLFGVKAAIPDPPLFIAQQLKQALEKSQISVTGIAKAIHPSNDLKDEPQRTIIHSHFSPPLKDIVQLINEKSNNLFAEHILKMIGKQQYNYASTEKGVEAIEKFYRGKGLRVEGMELEDGSGLSRRNGITPFQLAKVLSIASNDSIFNPFYASLAVAGESGTVTSLCYNTSATGNVRAKSGTLTGVKSYAGYVTTNSGRLLTFAVIANNYTCSNTAMKYKWERLICKLPQAVDL